MSPTIVLQLSEDMDDNHLRKICNTAGLASGQGSFFLEDSDWC